MTWAAERRMIVWGVIAGILAILATLFYFAVFYRAPACVDGIQNGEETAPDRGGNCPYLDNAFVAEPTVLYTKAVLNGEGRTDVIALVENKNQDAAAMAAPYALTVYGYDQQLIQRVTGTIDLPPGETVPVFVAGISSGQATPGAAFLTFDTGATLWHAVTEDARILPKIENSAVTGATSTPRVTATLSNADVRPMKNVKVIVIIESAAGNAIAASQTIIPTIPAQGSAVATFTWNAPFTEVPGTIEIYPIIPLPPTSPEATQGAAPALP